MKKISIALLALTFLIVFAACSSNKENTEETKESTSVEQIEDTSAQEESKEDESSEEETEWQKFLNDYDKWVDTYIELLKKYKENPTDATLITEYAKLSQEALTWTEDAEAIQADLEKASPDELIEYSKQLTVITEKLSAATAELAN